MRKVKYKAISPEGQVHWIDNLLKWVDEMNANGKLFLRDTYNSLCTHVVLLVLVHGVLAL